MVYRASLEDMRGARPFTAAEERLIAQCRFGEVVEFGNGAVPGAPMGDVARDKVEIRGGLIRHLVLGGCDGAPVATKGVQIKGAWVCGVLDLGGCESSLDILLGNCKFEKTLILRGARLGAVMLPGCHVPGIDGDRLYVAGSILLNKGFTAQGPVIFGGADIGRQLDCYNGTFFGKDDAALSCQGAKIGSDVFLSDGFSAMGMVSMFGATIGGQLECVDGRFENSGNMALLCEGIVVSGNAHLCEGFSAIGDVHFECAIIRGHLKCDNGEFKHQFFCHNMNVGGRFYWRDVRTLPNAMDLTGVKIGTLYDDAASWDGIAHLFIGGFRYDRIISEMSTKARLTWLEKKSEEANPFIMYGKHTNPVDNDAFDPQPYSQLAAVLRVQGNANEADKVLFEREKRKRRAEFHRGIKDKSSSYWQPWSFVTSLIKGAHGYGFRWLFGYGHRPMRAFIAVAAIWVFCYILYGAAYNAGQMAPNSDVILTSTDWGRALTHGCANVADENCDMPLFLWAGMHGHTAMATSVDYETFNAGLYALDLFVPLDALGQEKAWAPSKDRGNLGYWAYYLRWVVQMAGWIITAVGAATLTGLVGRKE